ncbi:MAG: HdeD family acid-resistance protein [Xanthobacteraceae bacterium]
MSVSPGGSMQPILNTSLRERWGLFLGEGIVLVVLGMLAVLLPPLATLTFTLLIGWLFLISGGVGLVTTFMAREAPGFWWSLLSALLGIGAGIVLLIWPVSGAVSLTLLLIVFFIVEGIASIMYAFEHRQELTGRWMWMLISGIIDLVLAAMIWAGLPSTATWALGLLVGINLLFGGAALIGMALHARNEAAPTTPPRTV